MSEHAPMPWVVGGDDWKPWEGAISVIGADYETICWTTSGGGIPSQANAAFIVQAVNNHEAMDKLLAEAADYLNSHSGMDGMDLGNKITQFRRHMQADLIAPRHT